MRTLLFFLIFLFPTLSIACMPPMPSEVMVGKIDTITRSGTEVFLHFKKYDFPFRTTPYVSPLTWEWNNYSDTAFPDIGTGETIIALSDAQDGWFPEKYSIFHITTLTCKDNSLSLWKRYGTIMGWNKEKWSGCGYQAKSLLDVFIEWSESDWIRKLEERYPTCEKFETRFKEVVSQTESLQPGMTNDVQKSTTGFWLLDKILEWLDWLFWLF